MSNIEIPSGAYKAIINYGEVLAKLDETNVNKNFEFNKESIKKTHKYFSNMFGEESVIRAGEEGTFELLCDAPFMSSYGQDHYPTVYDKAAKIMEGFSTHQVFTNGNKRLAVGATLQYLESQNIEVNLDSKSIYNFVLDISNYKFGKDAKESIPQIAKVIKENSVELDKNKYVEHTPVGAARTFNKEEYDDAKNNLDHGQDFTEEYEKE